MVAQSPRSPNRDSFETPLWESREKVPFGWFQSSMVLDGTPITCGLGISKGSNVVFRVPFNTTIMSLVLSFKSWKLNNSVLTSF
jgi:hypothetical protein